MMRSVGSCAPHTFARVTYRSIDMTISSDTLPGRMREGHETIPGTRMPPSHVVPFVPRKCPLEAPKDFPLPPNGAGLSPSDPLSLVKITIEFSINPRLESSARSTDVAQSMDSTAAP